MVKYDPLKNLKKQQSMLLTESIGYGIGAKITGEINEPVATQAFKTGSSLAGIPSLTFGAGNVLKSLELLDSGKKNKKYFKWK